MDNIFWIKFILLYVVVGIVCGCLEYTEARVARIDKHTALGDSLLAVIFWWLWLIVTFL